MGSVACCGYLTIPHFCIEKQKLLCLFTPIGILIFMLFEGRPTFCWCFIKYRQVLMKYMEIMTPSSSYVQNLVKKLSPPLGKLKLHFVVWSEHSNSCSTVLSSITHASVCHAPSTKLQNCPAVYNLNLNVHCFSSVTLLSSEPEVQYVALRNINLIVQKR